VARTQVVVEIYTSKSLVDLETFQGRLLGYITEHDFDAMLSSEKMRNSIFSKKTIKLSELDKAGAAINNNRLLFTVTKANDDDVFGKFLFITTPIMSKIQYTEKERTTIEFMGLETRDGEYISIVEEEI